MNCSGWIEENAAGGGLNDCMAEKFTGPRTGCIMVQACWSRFILVASRYRKGHIPGFCFAVSAALSTVTTCDNHANLEWVSPTFLVALLKGLIKLGISQ